MDSRLTATKSFPRVFFISCNFRGNVQAFRLTGLRALMTKTDLSFQQEIIKVREWIPHIGPLTKVIPLNKARFIRRINAVSNAIQTKDNEANHLIIYCLKCIRHGRNATYEPGLNLFLDMVPSSSEDVTRALRRCFRRRSVYAFSFRFEAKQNLKRCGDVFFYILITSKGASTLGKAFGML